jgi:Protein of unknown function (DUF3237)
MAIELVPLCTIRIRLKPPIEVGTGPAGTRMIFELASAEVKGDRLRGELLGAAAADWAVLGPARTGTLDIMRTLRTDDGATILGSTTAGSMHHRACSSR